LRLGFHLSISGGLLKALDQGRRTGCECVQIFSRNPRGWKSKPLALETAAHFAQARSEAGFYPLAVHLPYLPNLASPDKVLWEKSVMSLKEEMLRADLLKAEFVVVHPGHYRSDRPLNEALERVAQAVLIGLEGYGPGGPTLLLDTTSGQKGEIGADFSELARILTLVQEAGPDCRPAVCLDTAHLWGAGYDLRGAGLERTLERFDRTLGLERLALIHLNDSLADLGERRDRHAPVGRGRIGARAMARLVRHPDLAHLAGIMETPKVSEADDIANMTRAKRWRRTQKA
jgi:deoxyribonuclease-4